MAIKNRIAQKIADQKDRETRRQRMLVEQQAQGYEAGIRIQRELLIDTITRHSKMEAKLSQRMWQLKVEADVMKRNREIREQQYARYRKKDLDEKLRREQMIWRSGIRPFQRSRADYLTEIRLIAFGRLA